MSDIDIAVFTAGDRVRLKGKSYRVSGRDQYDPTAGTDNCYRIVVDNKVEGTVVRGEPDSDGDIRVRWDGQGDLSASDWWFVCERDLELVPMPSLDSLDDIEEFLNG